MAPRKTSDTAVAVGEAIRAYDEKQRAARESGKHTPGPWKWWTSNSWRRLRRDDRGISMSVIEPFVARDGHPDLDVSEADMNLIAAAPDLLAALKAIVDQLDHEDTGEPGLAARDWIANWQTLHDNAAAAVAKAVPSARAKVGE